MLAGFQILMILIAWFSIKFPSIIFIKNGEHLTIYNTAAPDSTIYGLGIALIFGASLIFPAFFYLLRIFKMRQAD